MQNMSSVGIVAEYNPFHNGHKYHIEQSRKQTGADVVVAVMSGNFTQRGELAIMDKWTRAELAVKGGADLVVELPTVAACSHASVFAENAINILQNLCVRWISFGSECGSLQVLTGVAEKLAQQQYVLDEGMKKAQKEGVSWPKARQEIMKIFLSEEELGVLKEPNNILALEYLKYMDKAIPVTVKRQGTGYHEERANGSFASASFIRKQAENGISIVDWIPNNFCVDEKELRKKKENMFTMLANRILMATSEELDEIASGGEGLGNKAKNEIRSCRNADDLFDKLKSKRYTMTRVKRFGAQILLEIKRQDVAEIEPYVRVLAFNEKGGRYLKQLKKAEICRIPVITNINKEMGLYPQIEKTLDKDILAADLYNLAAGRNLYEHSDFVECVRIFRQTP